MIAKNNVKVNGRWYAAGEELPEEPRQVEKPVEKEAPVAEPVETPKTEKTGEAKAETRTRSSGRNRK